MAESKGIVQTLGNNVEKRKRLLLALRYRNMTPAYVARLIRRVQALSTAKLVSGLDGAVTKGELSEAETNDQFGDAYRTDGRIDLCENPRTGANRAPSRIVPVIG